MKLYHSTNNLEKFQIKNIPANKYGYGWLFTNDFKIAIRNGVYTYSADVDITNGRIDNSNVNWITDNQDNLIKLISFGSDLENIAKFGRNRKESVDNYFEYLNGCGNLFAALKQVQHDLFNKSPDLWSTKVSNLFKLNQIIFGSSILIDVVWNPTIIKNILLVKNNVASR